MRRRLRLGRVGAVWHRDGCESAESGCRSTPPRKRGGGGEHGDEEERLRPAGIVVLRHRRQATRRLRHIGHPLQQVLRSRFST